ncbi:chromatin remodeling complex subunit, partial [Chytridium lagenaria]
KWIIFSQFTRMIDILEIRLERKKIRYIRYDGSMSSKVRERNLQAFSSDETVKVCLISLQCGAFGLNLTAANRVILFDIWWNPMVESQAIDRVHRIGQKKTVEITRLTIKDSVEDQILSLQEKKSRIINGALENGPLQHKFT